MSRDSFDRIRYGTLERCRYQRHLHDINEKNNKNINIGDKCASTTMLPCSDDALPLRRGVCISDNRFIQLPLILIGKIRLALHHVTTSLNFVPIASKYNADRLRHPWKKP